MIEVEFNGKKYQVTKNENGELSGRVQVRGKKDWHWQKMPHNSKTLHAIVADGGNAAAVEENVEKTKAAHLIEFIPLPEGVSLEGANPDDPWWGPTWAEAKTRIPSHLHMTLGLGGLSPDGSVAYFKLPGNRPWIEVKVVI
jgi:hypothetical protein